jgi:hypothetical protein
MVVDPEDEKIDEVFVGRFDGPDPMSEEAQASLRVLSVGISTERHRKKRGYSLPKRGK